MSKTFKADSTAHFKNGEMYGPVEGYTKARYTDLGPNGKKIVDQQRVYVIGAINRVNAAVAKVDKNSPEQNNEAIGDLVAAYMNYHYGYKAKSNFLKSVGGYRDEEDYYYHMPTPASASVMEILEAQNALANTAMWNFYAGIEKVVRSEWARRSFLDIVRSVEGVKDRADALATMPKLTVKIIEHKDLRKAIVNTLLLLQKHSHALVPPGSTPCPRCGGIGFLAQFLSVMEGQCFACGGSGVKSSGRAKSNTARLNPLSFDNRFAPEPMKRYPRSRLVASLSAPPRQRVQVERMVNSPHTLRVVVLEDNKTMCAVTSARSEEHVEFMRSLAKPGVITLLTDLKNNNVKAEGVLHLYSAFSFVHRLGDFITGMIFPVFRVESWTHPTSVHDIFDARRKDAFIARSTEPQTERAYWALSDAIGDSGVRALTSHDWKRSPDDPSSGRNILRRFIVTHTNSDMHRKGKVKPAFWSQSAADWFALSEMPSARARKGRGEPWLLFPPRPGEYDPEVEAVLRAYAEAINTFFPPFAQAVLTNLEGSVIDITVCDR